MPAPCSALVKVELSMKPQLERLRFKEVAERMPEAVVVTDDKGRIAWTNPAFHELCGFTPEEVKGRKPGSFLQGSDTDPETIRALRKAVKRESAFRTEILNYHKDGHPYWASVSITPMRDAKGALEGFVAIECDVTAKRERFDSLEEQVVHVYSALLTVESEHASSPGFTTAPFPNLRDKDVDV